MTQNIYNTPRNGARKLIVNLYRFIAASHKSVSARQNMIYFSFQFLEVRPVSLAGVERKLKQNEMKIFKTKTCTLCNRQASIDTAIGVGKSWVQLPGCS